MAKHSDRGRAVLDLEIEALKIFKDRIDASFDEAVELLKSCDGKIIVTGLGKSGHVGRKISATLSSLGASSLFMHSAEALHGDSGMMDKQDVLLAISNSGGTVDVVGAAELAKDIGLKIIAVTANKESPLAKCADVWLDISVSREADHLNLAPTSSSTVTLALGDALAVAVSQAKGFNADDFAFYHSGGALGKKSKSISRNK